VFVFVERGSPTSTSTRHEHVHVVGGRMSYKIIGRAVPRTDNTEKVTGAAR
jgi:hypothetical protein